METGAETELIEQARTDPAAFGVLYDRYMEGIYRYVYARVRDRSIAEDITEDVFFNALKNIKTYQHVAAFSAWLYRIAYHAIVDHYRRRGRQTGREALATESEPTDLVLDLVVQRDLQRRVWEAIDRLPHQQRTAMMLKFSADLSHHDVGRRMQKSTAAAKLLVHRAVRRLRYELVPMEA